MCTANKCFFDSPIWWQMLSAILIPLHFKVNIQNFTSVILSNFSNILFSEKKKKKSSYLLNEPKNSTKQSFFLALNT